MKNKIIVIINGSGGVGKDSFCNLCSKYIPTMSVSTIDVVKQSYKLLGWNGIKTENHRKALSDIKDIATKNLNYPYNFIKSKIDYFKKSEYVLMFIHSREPNEIKMFVEEFGCFTLLITNKNVNMINTNHADLEVENYNYDFIIKNDNSLEELDIKAKQFIEIIFNKKKLNKRNKIIVFTGKKGSGKSSLLNYMLKNYNYKNIENLDTIDLSKNNYVAKLTIKELQSLKKKYADNIISFYIDVDDSERTARVIRNYGWNRSSWEYKLTDDEKTYTPYIVANNCDFIVQNYSLDNCVKEIIYDIKQFESGDKN